MQTVIYPAVVTEADGPLFTADFPDFADLRVSASTPGELIATARERLSARLKSLEGEGLEWPRASSLSQSAGSRLYATGSIIWVDISVDDTPVRVTISLGERQLARIDAAAEARAMTRSGFLAWAATKQMESDAASAGSNATSRAIIDEVVAAGRKVQETLGPNSPVGRTLAELDAIALDGLRRLAGGVSDAVGMRPRTPPASSAAADQKE